MNRPKRHHFVAQMLSRRFTDDSGRLYFFDKRRPEKGVLYSKPINVFVEGELYTQYHTDGQKDVSVEKMLANVDDAANAVLQRIIDAARTRNVPNLTVSERSVWDVFLYQQWKRVPDFLQSIMTPAELDQHLQDSLQMFEQDIRPLTKEERERLNDPDVLDQIRHSARAKAVAYGGEEVLNTLADKGLNVALISTPNKSFVIGSHPVVKLTYPGRSNLDDPSVEVWLPIAHDVAVMVGFSGGSERFLEMKDHSHIRYINEAMFRQSTVVAGRSRALIVSLASAR